MLNEDLPLGKEVSYPSTYTPSLLRSIERADSREGMGIYMELPFRGEDLWTCYEFSWLNDRGRPMAAIVTLKVPCNTSCLVESKSLKLYLNSFAQTRFSNRTEVQRALDSDLSLAFRGPVMVNLVDVDQAPLTSNHFLGESLDHLDVTIHTYEHDPALLRLEASRAAIRETLHSHLFRSVCPVTGQPDWASVMLQYAGQPIDHASLVQYLVSFRTHAAFHESTVEQIFMDLKEVCQPDSLSVYARFLRRGGIDINPFRSDHEDVAPEVRVGRQ